MSVEHALRAAWAKLWSNPVLWVGGFVIAAFLGSSTGGILLGPLIIGLLRAVDREEEGGPAAGLEALFQGFDAFGPALVVTLLSGVAVMAGATVFLFPALLFLPLPLPALWYVARGERDPMRALSAAWAAIAKDGIASVGLHAVLLVVGVSGYLLLGFGEVVTLPLAFVAAVTHARGLVGPPSAGRPPRTARSTPAATTPATGSWWGGRGPFSHPTPSPLPGADPMGPEIK
ncbi:MAG: hypothetical protein RLZZ383_1330 [Pseudomonadota bacterium]|jgi:hypothetical protein